MPMKVEEVWGSSEDLVLITNPAEVSCRTASCTTGCRDSGDGPKKEMSSRYWAVYDRPVKGLDIDGGAR